MRCASLLLAIGWKLSGVAQQVVSRLLAATYGVDALVIVFWQASLGMPCWQWWASPCFSFSASKRQALSQSWVPPPPHTGSPQVPFGTRTYVRRYGRHPEACGCLRGRRGRLQPAMGLDEVGTLKGLTERRAILERDMSDRRAMRQRRSYWSMVISGVSVNA
jgi:hypothetical protein